MITLPNFINQLQTQAEAVQHLVSGVSAQQARWKPDDKSWSILEVVNHLYDEEREDFRARLRLILSQTPGEQWPSIDPQGWVTARRYNERDVTESLANFLTERQESLSWLGDLTAPNWDTAVEAPWGAFRAGDMLSAWVAHDLLHLRQLIELHYAYHAARSAPYVPRYAGEW